MKLSARLLNSRVGGCLAGWIFAHMSFLIPVKRLRETDTLLAFHHPQPAHPFHVLLVPKKELHSFADLQPADPFLADLVACAQSIAAEYHLPAYRLIVNAGEYQEFPQLHFHLVSDSSSPTTEHRQLTTDQQQSTTDH